MIIWAPSNTLILESPFTAPLRLVISRSKITLMMIVAPLLFMTAVVIWYSTIHWALSLLIVLLNASIAYFFIRLHYWQDLKSSVLEINQDANKQWSLRINSKNNDWKNVALRSNSFVSTYLIVLNFLGEDGRYSVILPTDSLDEDTFRRLRVRIKVAFD